MERVALEGHVRGGMVMRNLLFATISLAALSGCGLENLFSNTGGEGHERPASAIRGQVAWAEGANASLTVLDGAGTVLAPFQQSVGNGRYEVRLPSGRYSMVRVEGRAGDLALRAIVPFLGEESAVADVNLDARNTTEALIVETKLGIDGASFQQITPEAYLGTRALIQAAFDVAGPTQDLLRMMERLIARTDPLSGSEPVAFRVPVVVTTEAISTLTASPVSAGWLQRNPIDYDGVLGRDDTTAPFDQKLLEVAQLYEPQGCPSPDRIRVMFTVDFREGALNGSGATVNRFKWATDRTGKSMFFVGWVHEQSVFQDPAVHNALGAGVPNQLPMSDDGTNGDEAAGDGVWTISFDLPRNDLRIGYKYTWGTRGESWTGTEEWPGNSRIIEIADLNGDEFVYRRDVFGDESTNKDRSNLRVGTIDWETDVRGCGIPEAREQRFVELNAATCGSDWHTPKSIGPITVACTEQ
jgi:hypothetical protein